MVILWAGLVQHPLDQAGHKQLGPKASKRTGDKLYLKRGELSKYCETVSGLLLDKSESRGITLDPAELGQIVHTFSRNRLINLPNYSRINSHYE